MLRYEKLYVASAGKKGRGVFARARLRKREVLEIAPYIKLPARDNKSLRDTMVNNYWFSIHGNGAAIGLGLTSMYNHSEEPNAEAWVDCDNLTITIKAIKPISPDEEITLDYGYKLDS